MPVRFGLMTAKQASINPKGATPEPTVEPIAKVDRQVKTEVNVAVAVAVAVDEAAQKGAHLLRSRPLRAGTANKVDTASKVVATDNKGAMVSSEATASNAAMVHSVATASSAVTVNNVATASNAVPIRVKNSANVAVGSVRAAMRLLRTNKRSTTMASSNCTPRGTVSCVTRRRATARKSPIRSSPVR